MPADRSCHAEHSCCASASAVPTANLQPHEGSVLSRIRIVQMDCPTEERLLREVLEARPEVLELHFNLLQRVLTVRHQPHSLDAVLAGIDSLGFTPQLLGDEPAPAAPLRPWWPLAVAGALALGAEVSRDETAPAQDGTETPAQAAAAQPGTARAPQTAEFDPESPVARTARSASAEQSM